MPTLSTSALQAPKPTWPSAQRARGLKAGWASNLGTHSMGRYLINAISGEGIDCSHVNCDATQKSSFQFKCMETDSSAQLVEYHRKGSAANYMGVNDIDEAWLLLPRHLHATDVFAAISAITLPATCKTMALMRAADRSVSFDLSLRPTLWVTPELMRASIHDLAKRAVWVLPGQKEGLFLTGDGYVPDFPAATVVDTVSADDGFAVCVINALLDGRRVSEAVTRGAWIGAHAVQGLGDGEGLPTRAELDEPGL